MKDYSKAWRISGSALLEACARTYAASQAIDLSKLVDRAVREHLLANAVGTTVPPPLAPAKRGPKPKRKARR